MIYAWWTGDSSKIPPRPPIPNALKQKIMKRDGCTCQCINEDTGEVCGRSLFDEAVIEIHHWLPYVHFPWLALVTWNLVCACFECNRSLGASIPKYARDWDNELEKGKIIGLATEMQPPRGIKKWLKAASF